MEQLFNQLLEAYSDANLNRVSGSLIHLYKSKQYIAIREISNKISQVKQVLSDEKISKCFSNLMMFYHPDKGELLRKEIRKSFDSSDLASLNRYSHIFVTGKLLKESYTEEVDTDIDYQPEYVWDESIDEYGFHTYRAEDLSEEEVSYSTEEFERSFYNVLKLHLYGHLDINFPSYYLQNFEEIEMADSDLEYLDGIQYCKHAKIVNLSGNRLSDLAILYNLKGIEELYLADNQIIYIEILGRLPNLKSLDLSNNEVEDISPLFQLDNLQYLNIIGNIVPAPEIAKMKNLGVMVVY